MPSPLHALAPLLIDDLVHDLIDVVCCKDDEHGTGSLRHWLKTTGLEAMLLATAHSVHPATLPFGK